MSDAPDQQPPQEMTEDEAGAVLVSRRFVVLLVLAAIVGVIVSLASWCFLELVHGAQTWVYDDIPDWLGFDGGAPWWWALPVLALAGVIVAFAIAKLPGEGGHVPANGLSTGMTEPNMLPGVMLAAVASISLGAVIGPEAPLIALGGGLGLLFIRRLRADAPEEVGLVVAAAGTFAAVSLIFDSPLIAAVLMIEAIGIGGRRMPIVLLPGLLAAGIGSLVSIGMGSWTGLSTSDYAISALTLPELARPTAVELLWTIPLAIAIAVAVVGIVVTARRFPRHVHARPFLWVPIAGLAIAGLAIVFAQITPYSIDEVLFSGQETLDSLTANGGDWPVGDLALLLVFKGVAWTIALAAFRGGPTFPALLLGAAAGLVAAKLPGFDVTAAVAVGMGAATVAVLRLPLSAIVLAIVLTARSGAGVGPLVIVGVVVAYLVTLALERRVTPSPLATSAPPGLS